MSMKMEDDIKRWTAKRKSALVLDIIQGKTTVAEASRQHDHDFFRHGGGKGGGRFGHGGLLDKRRHRPPCRGRRLERL